MRLRPHFHRRDVSGSSSAAATPISYNADSYSKVYNYPEHSSGSKPVIAVISLGGGLYGSVNPTTGVLTGGDVHQCWSSIGIPDVSQSTVVVISVSGAVNTPDATDNGSTIENSLDVEIIGANCPGSTILFYLAPNTTNGFYQAFKAAINNKVNVNGTLVTPSVISCSWGAAEKSWPASELRRYNALFEIAVAKGISICCATGDNGSSDGLTGLNADFPASSPNVVACGGTTLRCSGLVYDNSTTEVAWSSGGGGISAVFSAPSYQIKKLQALKQNKGVRVNRLKRTIPDIALNADPYTGINILVGGQMVVVGGTSCAAPAMAAFIARAGITKFLTPLLYTAKNSAMCFHDIGSGSNGAYTASADYDYCTGLGSINGSILKTSL
jgi:kumamolisin